MNAGRILILPKGNYDESAQYEMLDLVYYKGASWIAKKTVTGIAPSESEYWQKIAESGVAVEVSTMPVNCIAGTSVGYNLGEPTIDGYTKIGVIHQLGVEDAVNGNATLYQSNDTEGKIYADFTGKVKVIGTFIFTM